MDDFFLELDGNRDLRLRFTPEVAGDELRLSMAGGVAAGVFAEQALVTYSANDIPADEREVLTARAAYPASPAIGLLRFVPRNGAVEFTAPRGENPFIFYGETLRRALENPHTRFPLVLIAKATIPAPSGDPDPFRALYYLVRFEPEHAARADAIDAFADRGDRVGWLDWKEWAGEVTARPWGDLSEPERLLAIAETRERQIERMIDEQTPYYSLFHQPYTGDLPCAGGCDTAMGERFVIAGEDQADALETSPRAKTFLSRVLCAACLGIGGNNRLDATRFATLNALKAAWREGRLVSGSFAADLHALNVLVIGKEGYFTVAERQAKELVDLLTFGSVTDLTPDKSVSGNGADALFFARRGLFTRSTRSYIAVEVKTTNKVATLGSQLTKVRDTVRNVKAAALHQMSYASLTKDQKVGFDDADEIKRWYRYYVAEFVYERLSSPTPGANLGPNTKALVTALGELLYSNPDLTTVLDRLAEEIESVLVVRFTTLDANGGEATTLDVPKLAASTAVDRGRSYFDSSLYFDLFGDPISALCESQVETVSQVSVVRTLAAANRLLVRLRLRVHRRNHRDQYPAEVGAAL
ncbi:MAG: hypothetical protein RL698_1403 [Pseudomonadota bacterium]|jgi:hypothetical protein